MKFLTITLRGIRNFDQRRIQFQSGINIICGPNESGKTTIVDSLLFSIAGPDQNGRDLIQWDSAHSSIILQYETDEGEINTLTRTLYPQEKSTLENSRILEDEGTIRSVLKGHFGCTSQLALENSAVVKHNEMEIMRKMGSRDTIRRQIEAFLMGGAKRSFKEVIEILERSIFQIDRDLTYIDIEIEQELKNLQPYLDFVRKYDDLARKMAVYQEDKTHFKGSLETYHKRVRYGSLVQEIKSLIEVRDQVEDIESYMQSIPFEKVREIYDLHQKVEETEGRISGTTIIIGEKEEELKKLLEEQERDRYFLGWIVRVFSRRSASGEENEKKIDAIRDRLEREKKYLDTLVGERQEIQDRIRTLETEIGDFEGKSYEELTLIKQEKLQERETILQGRTMEELTALVSQRMSERDELRITIFKRDLQLLEMDDGAVKEKLEELERKITWLVDEIGNINSELEEARTGKEEAERIKGRLVSLRSQKEELKVRKEVDEITKKTLEEAYTGLKEKFIPRLQERAGAVFEKITRGKYTELVIREEDLEIFVKTPERLLGTSAPSQGREDQFLSLKIAYSALSQGTRDQLHLSLRIALSDIVSGGKALPLIFDESFYTSDESRLKETFSVLQYIAQTNQILLFTHNEEFLQYGNPIILASGSQ